MLIHDAEFVKRNIFFEHMINKINKTSTNLKEDYEK